MRHLILLLFPLSSIATELEKCLSEPGIYEAGCYAEEMTRKEAVLEDAFKKKLAYISDKSTAQLEFWSDIKAKNIREQFLSSQDAWKKYSDAWCNYQYESINGTAAARWSVMCKIKLIEERLKQINE